MKVALGHNGPDVFLVDVPGGKVHSVDGNRFVGGNDNVLFACEKIA